LIDLDLVAQTPGTAAEISETFPRAHTVAVGSELTGNLAAQLLLFGIPSLTKPIDPPLLAEVISSLLVSGTDDRPTEARPGVRSHLDEVRLAYGAHRGLSAQQELILRLYFSGAVDKEIAAACGCAHATVYEHWRRMARKAGGTGKQDVIADFHRFLARD
jgi:DNA-binding NarL/FixJ family response regulator